MPKPLQDELVAILSDLIARPSPYQPGTSVEIWHASTLGLGHALPAALALQRFTTTFDATQAIATGRAGTAQGHVPPKVHVTLWANR